MHCGSCQSKVEAALLGIEAVTRVSVDLSDGATTIEMSAHIALEDLQQALHDAGLSYGIGLPGKPGHVKPPPGPKTVANGDGIFYCLMHCEGDKTYTQAGSCPACGMDLLEQPNLLQGTQYTCPMHPDVVENKPGDCPICGMGLVAMAPD